MLLAVAVPHRPGILSRTHRVSMRQHRRLNVLFVLLII